MKRVLLLALISSLFLLFCWLGSWQLERRIWKLALIDHVDQQLQLSAIAAPGPDSWGGLVPENVYQPVVVSGRFLHESETLVQAMTTHGSGYWVLTPFETEAGFIVLVNRGFVDSLHKSIESRRLPALEANQLVELTGLLRITEPRGRMLQANKPAADRWYSRDVEAIGNRRALAGDTFAPYFIDANPSGSQEGVDVQQWPVAGLTVVSFRNTHLVYAITWYLLALLCVAAIALVVRVGRNRSE